jgi:hypothetical protein
MKKFSRVFVLILVVLSFSLFVNGCYLWSPVKSHEVGLVMNDGMKIDQVVGPGLYNNGRWFSKKPNINCSAITIEWADPDLWTKDKQPVAFKVAVTFARQKNATSVINMWNNYNFEARNDEALAKLVLNRIPRVAKQITTRFTLDEMLGVADGQEQIKGREALQSAMFELLTKELDEFGVQLLDIGANDIGADPNYVAKLTEKATSKVAVELAIQKTKQLEEQVKQEAAQTLVEMEIARRDNRVAAEKNKVYQLNRQAYELEKLKIMGTIFGEKDKIWIIPNGSDLNIFSNIDGKLVPVQ